MAKTKKMVVSMTPNATSIDVCKLPAHESDALCQTLISSVKKYFELPGVAEEYEKWLVERRKKQAQGVAPCSP